MFLFLLENNNKYAFIDTGSLFYYPMIENHLNERNIKELEFIILTHFHSDHYGNIINIVNNYKVKNIYLKHYYGLDGTTSSGFASNEEYIENEINNYNNVLKECIKNNVNIIYIDDLNRPVAKINVSNYSWDTLASDLDTHKFASDFMFNITTTDALAEVKNIEYYLHKSMTALEDYKTVEYTKYENEMNINEEGSYIIYAKIINSA